MAQDQTTAQEPASASAPAQSPPAEAAATVPTASAQTTTQAPLQVDDDLEHDSTYAPSEGNSSFLSSLNSSILNYKYENGRRYHAFREGAYLVPNDDDEQDRMDLVHHLYRLLLRGELHLAPISENPQRVLDLGTGTGIWAMEFADQFSSAEVLGTDLSPIQPKWTPPNCTFEVDDFEQDWIYRKPFDYIHARELGGCVGDDEQLFRRAYEHLAPGGYFEMQAVYPRFLSDDGTAKLAVDAQFWMTNICEGSGKFGKPLDAAPTWLEKFKAAGFTDVHQDVRKLPIGSWPKDPHLKEMGKYQIIQEQQVIDSYTPALFSRVLGWEETEIQILMAKVKNDLKNPAIHLYIPVYFVWGRKPEEA
ncbi:S-adenosyl-L-methionine-dependent methyltransferase [Plectosphaerella cucumerina]|uniref:S-adenosyl-L-methionine-dependent methyltransferase n=1 Tax=Plectosphaerella cucumerina TaxID=40658 RepID=A0A8K0X2Z4_9PEZI|nr:S-adenosyl-L-methionine-dependent methyltransferase [Plectosphaerella cucumerina]